MKVAFGGRRLRASLMLTFHVALSVSLSAGSVSGQIQLTSATSAASTQASPAADAPADRLADVKRRRTELGEDLQRIEAELKASGKPGSEHQVSLLGHLRFLDSVLAQHQIVLEREKEVQADYQQTQEALERLELLGTESVGGLTFVEIDQLRDKRDDLEHQAELAATEIKSTVALLASVQEQYKSNERRRRQIQEELDGAKEGAPRVALVQELELVESRSRLARALIDLRSAEHRVRALEQDATTQQLSLVDDQLKLVNSSVPFTQADLELLLKNLTDREEKLNVQLIEQQTMLRSAEQLFAESQAIEAGEIERRRRIRRTLNRSISYTNEAMTTSLLCRHAWKMRFQVANGLVAEEQMRQFYAETEKFLERVRDAQTVLNTRLQEMRLDSDVASRSPEGESPQAMANLQTQVVQASYRSAGQLSRLLRQGERILGRMHDELESRLELNRQSTSMARFIPALRRVWSYELVAVDDKPITIGKLVSALVLLGFGILLARQVSRMVGNRVLPRLGVHQGASLAAQTIAFYSLSALFGFVTLEILSIPITVLTFFGGAAAIAVGFGAQNILNNFMSGLIILGEQPIRLGDLIEVDGLHGTIEHIGARSTRVRTGTNFEIIIPNSKFLENNVKNLTLSSNEIRTSVSVGVAYGTDVALVMKLLKQVCVDNPAVLRRPEPIVLFSEFGDNSLNFQVHFWLFMRTQMDKLRVESDLRQCIDGLFKEHRITISFPQRDVHLDVTAPIEVRLADRNLLSDYSSRRDAA